MTTELAKIPGSLSDAYGSVSFGVCVRLVLLQGAAAMVLDSTTNMLCYLVSILTYFYEELFAQALSGTHRKTTAAS